MAATWAALNAIPGTRAGQPGRVTGPDAGTHTDPVVGGTKANIGEYAWSEAPAGWQWLQATPTSIEGTTVSTGADDAGKATLLDAAGKLDGSVLNSTASRTGAGDAGKVVTLPTGGYFDPSFYHPYETIDAISKRSSSVAAAATLDLEGGGISGDYVPITGSTPVTAVTLGDGHARWLKFVHGTTFVVGAALVGDNGGADVVFAAGDMAYVRAESAAVYFRTFPAARLRTATTSTGAPDAGKVPLLGAGGKLHGSFLDLSGQGPQVNVELSPLGSPMIRSPGGRASRVGNVFTGDDGVMDAGPFSVAITQKASGSVAQVLAHSYGGRAVVVAETPDPDAAGISAGTSATRRFKATQYAYAQSVANTELARRMSQPISYAALQAGWRLMISKGQSKDAAADHARLYGHKARLSALGVKGNVVTISRDGRSLPGGTQFVTYDSEDRTFHDIRSNMVFGGNAPGPDAIVSAVVNGDVDNAYERGDYPLNSRGEWPMVITGHVRRYLQCQWLGIPYERDYTVLDVFASASQTDALAVDVYATGSNGRSRGLDYVSVFEEARAVPDHETPGFIFPVAATVRMEAQPNIHGEADNRANAGLGTASYKTYRLEDAQAIWSKMNADYGQTEPIMFLERQVGGPIYGTVRNHTARMQSEMDEDTTGDFKDFWVVCQDYEAPTFANLLSPPSTHPNAVQVPTGDGHDLLAGALIKGVRMATAWHYLADRQEPYFLPYPTDTAFFEGKNFLIPIVTRFGGLHEAPMPHGITPKILSHWGFSFKTGETGANNAVVSINVTPIPGYTLIEGTCADDISGYTWGTCGENNGITHLGFVNVRDGFKFDDGFPIKLPFDANQIRYGNATFDKDVPGTGYRDVPATNGFGRYLEDIPGWVGDYDWGNPIKTKNFTLVPIPA